MSSTVRDQLHTPYGDMEVEYNVVECASCGQEIFEENATEFKLGSREGWACEYCSDNGPIDFPGPVTRPGKGLALANILLWPLATVIFVLWPSSTEHDRYFIYIWVVASAGAALWAGLSLWFLL